MHLKPDCAARPTIVARLVTDGCTAARLQDALAEICDGDGVAISIAQEPDERWSLAVHFSHRPDECELRAQIAAIAGPAAAAHTILKELAPTDWVRSSLEGLQPVYAGRFVVHGAYHRGRVRANQIGVQIEAALAFGTGHHGSTRGCLLALDRIAKDRGRRCPAHNPTASPACRHGACVLDVGTGSGILAIAAAKALHRPVLAGDIDARALVIARDNARINRVASRIEFAHAAGVSGRRFAERAPYAVVLANILLDPLRELATPLAKLVAPNGRVILSGLLNSQTVAAIASYRARGLVLAQRITLGGWTTLVLGRPGRVRYRF